jgi:hypothetical protein
MKTNQILDEARKYLLYAADVLHSSSQNYSIEKQDRIVLEKYASDLFDYSKGIEQLKNHIIVGEQQKKKIQIVTELENTYDAHRRVADKVREDLRIVKATLKKAEESGNQADIEEMKKRLKYYSNQKLVAERNELNAKIEYEKGV